MRIFYKVASLVWRFASIIAWTVLSIYATWVILTTSISEMVYQCHASFVKIHYRHLNGRMVAPDYVLGLCFMKKRFFLVIVMELLSVVAYSQIEYSVEFFHGFSTDENSKSSTGALFVIGVAANDNLHVGGGVGIRHTNAMYATTEPLIAYRKYGSRLYLPLLGRLKINVSENDISPFFGCDLGYLLSLSGNVVKDGENILFEGILFNPVVGLNFSTSETTTFFCSLGLNVQYIHFYGLKQEILGDYARTLALTIGCIF